MCMLCAGQGYEEVQVTLVDCPGHASLIRTIIGGKRNILVHKFVCMIPFCKCTVLSLSRAAVPMFTLIFLTPVY